MSTDKEKIAHLKELLKKAENDCKLLEARKAYYKNKCQNLIEDNNKINAEILDLFTRNQGQTIDLLNRKGRIIDLEKDLKDVNAQYAELEINHWTLQINSDNLQHNLNLSQQEIRDLEEAGEQLLKVHKNKEEEVLEIKNYNKQQLAREREIARVFYASQRQLLINASEKDKTNYLTALRNKQKAIKDLEEAGGALLDVFYNKEQELQSSQLDLSDLLERFNHSENTLESKNRFIIRLAQESNQKNQLVNQLQNRLNATEEQRDNYLTKLNELEADGRAREEILANKSAELTVLQLHVCQPCPLIHLPTPHVCPVTEVEKGCPHSDHEEIKKQKDSYQQQLTNQEKEIVQRLNNTFNFQAQDLDHAINELKKLIDKPPLTVEDKAIKEELERARELILKLEQQLQTPFFGEKIETIIKIDEKLLSEHEAMKVELNKKADDYQQLAEERNHLVLQQIKNINVAKLQELIPQVQKKEIKHCLEQANNYEQVSTERNKLIVKYLNNTAKKQFVPTSSTDIKLAAHQKQERIIWISLLAISLISIGGLLVKLRGVRKA